MITVYVLNGTSTSAGNGPGVADLPDEEARWLIAEGLAIRGHKPPIGTNHGPMPVSPP